MEFEENCKHTVQHTDKLNKNLSHAQIYQKEGVLFFDEDDKSLDISRGGLLKVFYPFENRFHT